MVAKGRMRGGFAAMTHTWVAQQGCPSSDLASLGHLPPQGKAFLVVGVGVLDDPGAFPQPLTFSLGCTAKLSPKNAL